MDGEKRKRVEVEGKGRWFALWVVPVYLAALTVTIVFPDVCRYWGKPGILLFYMGIIPAAAGGLLCLGSLRSILRGIPRGRRVGQGSYRWCRHPFTLGSALFLPAGIGLMMRSWPLPPALLPSGIILLRRISREEETRERISGAAYEEYRRTVPRFFPRPPRGGGRFPFVKPLLQAIILLGILTLGCFLSVGRGIILTWNTRAPERSRAYPGMEKIPEPRAAYLQAVTIDAPVEEVWQWLIQIGYARGWYNFDIINRSLLPDYFIEGRQSIRRIHPDLQNLKSGDILELAPGVGFPVDLDPPRSLVLSGSSGSRETDDLFAVTWGFYLYPEEEGKTRLVTSCRSDFSGGPLICLGVALMVELGGAGLQQPAMLGGIKARAEGENRRASYLGGN